MSASQKDDITRVIGEIKQIERRIDEILTHFTAQGMSPYLQPNTNQRDLLNSWGELNQQRTRLAIAQQKLNSLILELMNGSVDTLNSSVEFLNDSSLAQLGITNELADQASSTNKNLEELKEVTKKLAESSANQAETTRNLAVQSSQTNTILSELNGVTNRLGQSQATQVQQTASLVRSSTSLEDLSRRVVDLTKALLLLGALTLTLEALSIGHLITPQIIDTYVIVAVTLTSALVLDAYGIPQRNKTLFISIVVIIVIVITILLVFLPVSMGTGAQTTSSQTAVTSAPQSQASSLSVEDASILIIVVPLIVSILGLVPLYLDYFSRRKEKKSIVLVQKYRDGAHWFIRVRCLKDYVEKCSVTFDKIKLNVRHPGMHIPIEDRYDVSLKPDEEGSFCLPEELLDPNDKVMVIVRDDSRRYLYKKRFEDMALRLNEGSTAVPGVVFR